MQDLANTVKPPQFAWEAKSLMPRTFGLLQVDLSSFKVSRLEDLVSGRQRRNLR
jgi:hypothetical protein